MYLPQFRLPNVYWFKLDTSFSWLHIYLFQERKNMSCNRFVTSQQRIVAVNITQLQPPHHHLWVELLDIKLRQLKSDGQEETKWLVNIKIVAVNR
jgi:hypothetical protein